MRKIGFCQVCQEEVVSRNGYCGVCEMPVMKKRKELGLDDGYFDWGDDDDYNVEDIDEILGEVN